MPQLEREGIFEASPTTVAVERSKNGALMVNMVFEIKRQYDPANDTWTDPWPDNYTCRGNLCLATTKGDIMDDNLVRLARALGWDGRLDTLANGQWHQKLVQILVKANEYNGKVYYKADRVDQVGAHMEDGARGSSPEVVSQLNDQYGSVFAAKVAQAGIKPDLPPMLKPADNSEDMPF